MAEVKVTIVDTSASVSVCEQEVIILSGESGPQGPRGTQLLSGSSNPSISIGLIGDQYINTDTGYLFGPKTSSGWGGGVPLGINDPSDLGQIHYQTSPSTVWNINHTLSFVPNIVIVDLNNNVIEADINYVDEDTITATFSQAVVGVAYLS